MGYTNIMLKCYSATCEELILCVLVPCSTLGEYKVLEGACPCAGDKDLFLGFR